VDGQCGMVDFITTINSFSKDVDTKATANQQPTVKTAQQLL